MNILEKYPGSHNAVKAGCTCPIIDNHYGKGRREDYNEYLINSTCQLHSQIIKQNQAEMKLVRLSNPDLLKDLTNANSKSNHL